MTPQLSRLVDALAEQLVGDYLHVQPATRQEPMPVRTERAHFPAVERAA